GRPEGVAQSAPGRFQFAELAQDDDIGAIFYGSLHGFARLGEPAWVEVASGRTGAEVLREFYHRLGREIADSEMFARSLRATLRNLDNPGDAKSVALQRLGELRQNGLNCLARRALQSRDLSRELNGVSRC